MNSNPKNNTLMIYTALGFRTDIEKLFDNFAENNSTKFIVFAQCFRDMYFSLIFRGRHNDNEMHELIDECYLEVLSQLVNTSRLESHRIASLYLLYSLYVKQPLDESYRRRFDFKVRITLDQLLIIREFINECKAKNYLDVCYVWYKLVAIGVHFVYYKYEGIGPSNTRSSHYWLQNTVSSTDRLVNELKQSVNRHLKDSQMIHDMYVEYKDQVFDGNHGYESNRKPNLIAHQLFEDSTYKLLKLVNDFRLNRDIRGRGRPPLWTLLRIDDNQQLEDDFDKSEDEKRNLQKKNTKSKKNIDKGMTSGLRFGSELLFIPEDVKQRTKEVKKVKK